MKGPTVTMKRSCFDCEFCRSERYAVQGDSGSDVYCTSENRYIGDTTWATPDWCPFVRMGERVAAVPGAADEEG